MKYFYRATAAAMLMPAMLLSLSTAAAQTAPAVVPATDAATEFTGSFGPFFRERANVAIPAYAISFITQQEASAVRNINSRVRLNTILAGIDESLMRSLADEAHPTLSAVCARRELV